jgi:hypothetical protein
MPGGRLILYKGCRGASARGQVALRVLPLAAPRQVDTPEHAWEQRTWSREHWRLCH